ncbi:hypothetical protein ACH5RR_009354 [Cinchona calisaya]|uniref:Retrotransposon gag domain-containing protein n=1 Tax=Cinchona calisaya TaxID=153742 RepID=A0ABD3AGY1_9GENT
MLAIVDGSLPCPKPSDESYGLWVQCDTTVHSWINAILSLTVLETLLNHECETVSHAWNTLERLFIDYSVSTMHLKHKFQNFNKDNLTMEEYLQQLESLACSLIAIGKINNVATAPIADVLGLN